MKFFALIKKELAGALLLIFLAGSIVFPLNQARAADVIGGGGVPVTVSGDIKIPIQLGQLMEGIKTAISSIKSAVSNNITAGGISSLVIKEYVLDPIANIIAKAIIRAVTNTVVSWIQGGGKPMFVQDLGKEVVKAADETAGEFLNRLAGTNLCSGFNIDFRFNLTLPRIKRISECTLSGIISAVKGTTFNKEIGIFYNDFEVNGAERGIETYLALLDPANSFTNSFDKAYYTKASLEIQAGQKRIKIFDWGSGFKPFEWDETKDDSESCEPGADGKAVCQKVKTGRTMTPGKVVAETLQKSMDIGLEVGAIADELDEAIIAIINALINRVVNGSIQGSSGGGLTDEGSGSIPFDDSAEPTQNIPSQRADDVVIRTQIAQLAVTQKIITIDELIIKVKEDILKVKEEIKKISEKIKFCEENPSSTGCNEEEINKMKSDKTGLESKLKDLESQLADLEKQRIEEKIDFDKLSLILERGLALKGEFVAATESSEFTSLGQKLVALEEEIGVIIFNIKNRPTPRLVNGKVEFDNAGTDLNETGQSSSDSLDNTVKEADKIIERAELTKTILDKKIVAEKDLGKKAKFVQAKADIQKTINDLSASKTKILSMKGDPLADVKTATKTVLLDIKNLNQKLAEAFNL